MIIWWSKNERPPAAVQCAAIGSDDDDDRVGKMQQCMLHSESDDDDALMQSRSLMVDRIVRRQLQPCHLYIQQPQHTTRGRSSFGPRTSPISDSCDFPYLVTRSASCVSYLPALPPLHPTTATHDSRPFKFRASNITDQRFLRFPYLVTRSASCVSYLPALPPLHPTTATHDSRPFKIRASNITDQRFLRLPVPGDSVS
nr:uncharacterized protein LOC115257599 [Aedes albopictus]